MSAHKPNDSMKRPVPRAGIMAINAYVPGKSKAGKNIETKFKLSSNETPFGPSPKALKAFENAGGALEVYPDPDASRLREAIASTYSLDKNQIICGTGSDDILSLLAYGYLQEGDEAIITEHGFLIYKIVIQAAGGTPVTANEINAQANVDEILSCVSERTKIVFLANPNNPTGTFLPEDEIRRLHKALPAHVLLVLDAAYAEYVRREDYEAGIELVSENENVVMTRTFSKVFGLAFLRLGWAYAPSHVIDVLHRIRGPFNVNGAAIEAGIASMEDQTFLEKAVSHNEEWLPKVTSALAAIGLCVTPSVANFVLVHFPESGPKSAEKADEYLLSKGCILRRVTDYGFPNALRMSIGTQDANITVINHLADFMGVKAPNIP